MKKAALLLLAILTTAGMYAHTPENPAAKPKIKGSYAMDIDSPMDSSRAPWSSPR
ncbi:MAG: hypothetical protein R2751_00515 [Bacteroidales bacterium]